MKTTSNRYKASPESGTGRWNVVNSIVIISTLFTWVAFTRMAYWPQVLAGSLFWAITVLPATVKNMRSGKTAYVEYSYFDFASHLTFGYLSNFIISEFMSTNDTVYLFFVPMAISMAFGVAYEIIEYYAERARKFSDLNYEGLNSVFDLANHFIGCVIGFAVLVFTA